MIKDIPLKLNLYDQLGYLMVGAIAILILVFDVVRFYGVNVSTFSLENFLIWFITAYFLGHLIQGIANLLSDTPILRHFMEENKDDFDEREKEILDQVGEFFKLNKNDFKKTFEVCMMFATTKDITGQVQIFNATYSLYRGWSMVFFLQSFFLVYLWFSLGSAILLLLIISIFLTWIFYRRSKRFWKHTRNKILETFVVVKALKL